jgi:AcrR family transcriptional regulator
MPPRPRRLRDPEATRRALVAHATVLFAEHGYEGTSLEAVVSAAGVTKGAVYHHFTGKRELFEAVFVQVENDMVRDVRTHASTESAEARTVSGLRHFMTYARDPRYRQIVLADGPSVLGDRAQDPSRSPIYPSMVRTVHRLLPDWDLSPASAEVLARLLLALVHSAASAASGAGLGAEPDEGTAERCTAHAEEAVLLVFSALHDAGRTHPDAASAITATFAG